MNGGWRAWLRLFAVQGTWNYERMLGVGMGYAAEPLLDDLKTVDPVRHTEAVVRSAEFFNCHPNLAGLALGATTRAEYDGVPGAQIARLRTALCSPLGALGDQLFWAGLVPVLVGSTLVGVVARRAAGGRSRASWCCTTSPGSRRACGRSAPGCDAGMGVGGAIATSWISRAIEWVEPRGRVLDRPRRSRWSAAWYLESSAGPGPRRARGRGHRRGGEPLVRRLAHRGAVRAPGARPARTLPLGAPMIEREATIVNQEGLHARPAAKIVRLASNFNSEIELFKDGMAVNGKSIMGVMMLAAECGSSIMIRADGPDAEQAVNALSQLVVGRIRRAMSQSRVIRGIGVSPGWSSRPR